MTRGFLLGKFMPPTCGHVMLGEFAHGMCDELTILVCSRSADPIDGGLRVSWMRELFPRARVLHLTDEVPQEPADHPNFWPIWRDIVRRAHPEPIDLVFASEGYGGRLATEVGARYVPFDPGRIAVPISARQVRDDPYAAWQFLPPPVKAYYTKTVCLFGPESTGKSTLSPLLARALGTIETPEYGRTYCDQFGTDCSQDDLMRIAKGQAALEMAARRQANKLLVLDTDRLMTAVWARMLLGAPVPELEASPVADLYLFCGIDVPWADDGTRYFPDIERRQRFFDACREALESRGLPYVMLPPEPEARLARAVAAIKSHFPMLAIP